MRQTTLRGSTSPESETSLSSWPAGRAPLYGRAASKGHSAGGHSHVTGASDSGPFGGPRALGSRGQGSLLAKKSQQSYRAAFAPL